MPLTDQEIEAIAQRIVADLTGKGLATAAGKPAPSLAGELGVFDSIEEAVRAASVAFCQYDAMGLKKRNDIIASIRQSMREHATALAREAH